MVRRNLVSAFLPIAVLLGLGVSARAQTPPWWNEDYAQRIPVTVSNPSGGIQPTANQTAEVSLAPLPAEARADLQDLRVLYWSGSAWQQLDRQVLLDGYSAVYDVAGAGTTDYNTLPAGTKLTALTGKNDDATVIDLPFAFPFQGQTYTKLTVATDGFVKPGATTYGPRPDNPNAAGGNKVIFPFSSDFAVTDAAAGVYADTSNPNQVTIRWEVNESASGPVIAKFAAILYKNGDIRFVYGNPAHSPSAGIADPNATPNAGYWPVLYGVGSGNTGSSKVNQPAFPVDFAGHADIAYRQNLTGNPDVRVVFRLVTPVSDGSTSTGEYFVYYGNPSPSLDTPTNIYNVYDFVVDNKTGTVGQPADNWLALENGTATIGVVNGIQSAVLRGGSGISHPRYIVKPGSMPNFLNVEEYTQFTPLGGENEVSPMVRVPNDTANTYPDPNQAYGGGIGYATDGFGSQQGLVSYINPTVNRGPADFAGLVPGKNPDGVIENVVLRYQDQLLWGKKWTQYETQPTWVKAAIDRTAFDPKHNTKNDGSGTNVSDPVYDKPGAAGIGSYSTNGIAVHFMALRELITQSTNGAAATTTAQGPFIQGTVTSSRASNNPLTATTLHVTGPNGYDKTFAVGPNGQYRITLPAGTAAYTIVAQAPFHTDVTVTAAPSPATATNITLPYVGVKVTGIVRDALSNARLSGTTIVGVNDAGHRVGSTTTDAQGAYTLMLPTGGTYRVGAVSPSGLGDQKVITAATGEDVTVNLAARVVANGNMELPGPGETAPEGWSTQEFTPASPAGAFLYTQDQNRTPGGHWSLAVRDPGETSSWNPPNGYALPVRNDSFGVTVSVWVYFTAPGQMAALRLRNSFPTTGSTVGGRIQVVAGQANDPGNENTSLATVPVGQWFELRKTAPAGTKLDSSVLGMNLYARGPAGGGANGTIYFDDLTFTQTPVASVTGTVVDENGAPVADAYVGQMVDAGYFEVKTLFDGPFTPTDEQGKFSLYLPTTDPVDVAAWKNPPTSNWVLPDYGYVLGITNTTPSANPTPITLRIKRATNVADGAAVSAKDTGETRDITGNLKNAVDNRLDTRWDDWGGASGLTQDQSLLFDLGSAQQVDQIEAWWEQASPGDYSINVGSTPGALQPIYQTGTTRADQTGLLVDLTPSADGPIHVIKVPDDVKSNIRYIQIKTAAWGPYQNFSIIELRALNLAAPLPLSRADVIQILSVAGGLTSASAADVSRLDRNGDGKLTIQDAVALAKTL